MATIKEFTNYTGQETIYPVTVAQAVYVDNTKTVSQALNELTPSTTTPQNVATTGQAGQAVKYARGDHVHGIQLATGDNNGQVKIAGTNVQVKGLGSNAYTSTAFAPLASPALTGTPTAPTAAVDTNTTQIATTAFVNNQIEALKLGGRNLLKDSKRAISNGSYGTADYYFGDRPPLNGEIVTLQVKGALAETKTKWTPYNSGGSVQSPELELSSANYNSTTGIYTATGRWAVGNAANTFMRLYALFNNQAGTSQIEWAKLERGTKATDWTPAPEDLQTALGYVPVNKAGDTMSGILEIDKASGDTFVTFKRTDTGTTMSAGIGGGGVNHGLYSHTLGKWMVWGDASGVHLSGNADTATTATTASAANILTGFSSRQESISWGNQVGSPITAMNDGAGGSIGFRKNNPSNGKMQMVIDGTIYVNEGASEVYHPGNKPTKSDVGLGNVDNTSDLNKPISTATQTALDGKSPLAGSSSLATVASDVTYGDSGFQVVTSKVAGGASKQIGWYRIASLGAYSAGTIYHQGGYYTGWPTCAVCSFQTQHIVASIVQLAGVPKQIFKKYRLIRDSSSGVYYIDAYQAQDYTSGTMGAQIFTIVGNSSQPITALNPTEPTDDTTTAAAECTIVDVSGGYLPLKGGTLSGTLTVKGNQYADSYSGALNMANSNIYGVNSIYTADGADNAAEGIHFYRDSTHVDTLWMNGGDLLFVPNRALGTSTTKADSQKVGRFTANPTTGQVIITDGTTGGMKSSGYTIATSVPSGAKFTDTTYTFDTGDNNGQIKVTPLGGQAQSVQVKGLAALAYKASLSASEITNGITGVKGNAESTYRTGNVNLTPANIGAVNITSGFGQWLQSYSSYDDNSISGTTVKYSRGNATGKPPGNDHALFQMAYSDVWKTQLAHDWRTNKAYIRSCNNGTWYDWAEITTLGYTPVNQAGDTMTGLLTAPSIKVANTVYGVGKGRTTGTPKETILYTGIKWVSSHHMPVLHLTGFAYGLQSPVEFKIGFYIYGDQIGWCGAVNMGAWNPQIYLFKHTVNDVSYVAVGFVGQCYFLQLAVDVQSEMGNFQNIDLTSSLWSFEFLTTTGNVPAADGGATCIQVPYKADILNPSKVNGHTVESNVPSNAKFTDTWNANSKTVDGYVTKGQGNSNMFWGTDNEGNPAWRAQTLDVSSATGILPVAHGGTGVSSFTSGKVLVGAANGSIGYKDIVSISTAGSISGSDDLISANALSLWDGSFGSGNSNIKYTQLGELKSGAIKTSTQDLTIATDGYVLDARAGKTLKGLIDTASQKATAQEQWVQAHSKVENKTSTEILSELTKANVTAALEYEPPHKYTGSSGITVDNEAYTITNTGILTLAEGTTNGAFNYTSTAGGGSIPIHGLKSAAYLAAQNYATSETQLHKKHVGLNNVDNTADADKVVKEAGVAVKLKTPITVKIADATVTNVDWQSNLTITKPQLGLKLNDINPIVSGRYNGVIAEGDTHDTATFYFANLKPTSYYGVWKVRYRIYAIIASDADSSAMSDVEIWGSGQSVTAYKVFNAHRNTNNRPYYNHKVYHATEAGVATYGHIIGVDLRSSNHPTDANYSRSIAVDVLEAENCTVEMFPVVNLYPQVPGSGSTNYSAVSTFNGYTNGLQETGDLDTYDRVRFSSAIPAGDDIVSGNIIVMAVGSAYVHLNSGQAFYIGPPPLYAGQAIASGSQGTNNYAVFPVTIATTQALTMAQGQTVFIKGTVNGRIFTPVSETPLVAGAPSTEDSYSYMVLGYACSDTVMYLLPEHPIFTWRDGQFGVSVDSARYANRAGNLVSTTDPTSLDIAGGTQTLHYYIAGGGTGNNRPAWGTTVTSGTVLSMDWVSGQHATQLAQGVARSGQLAVRAKYNGTWSDWNYVFDSGHKPTKADVGLGNVDNTSDANKPVSTAQKTKIENDDATTLASAKSYADGLASDLQTAVNTKANDSAVVKLTGNQSIAGHKTFTEYFVANERAILKDGFYVHSAVGTAGSAGYVKVCDITLENTYGDQPIYFTFVRRLDKYPTVVSIRFDSANGADPGLNQITCFGYTDDVWITKSATSTWGVYILKTGTYDRIDIMDSNRGNYNSARVHFVWTDVLASSVPQGLVGRTQAQIIDTLYVKGVNDTSSWHRIPFTENDDGGSKIREMQHNDGLKYFWNPGVESSSTAGRGILRLGNNLLQTADGGARGELWLFGREASYYNVLVPQAGLTESVTNQIPYKAGILLNSSDLSQTKSGTLILSKTNAASATANNGPALMVGGTATTAHIEIDKNQIMAKSNATTVTGLSLGGGGTVTIAGTLVLSKNTDASGTANNSPALIVGGAATQAHLEFDANEIMAKGSGTAVGPLYINTEGGIVQFGSATGNHHAQIEGGVITARAVDGAAGGILRPILWGTGAATTSNCPNGCVYFRYS